LPSGPSSRERERERERELAEERTALAHDDRYQIDGRLVDQLQFQTLPSHSPGRDCDNTVAGDLLCPRDGGLDAAGGEGERSVWMGVDPVGRNIVMTTTTGTSMVCRPPQPSVKSNSVRPQTSAPSLEVRRRQYSALRGVRWKVITGVAVGNSTSPL
jgi:hypothetical protein